MKMQIWMYLLICLAASIYCGFEMGTVKGGVVILSIASLYSVAGFYIGHRVGHMQTTELMQKRIQQVGSSLPDQKTPASKRLKDAFRNKRLVVGK